MTETERQPSDQDLVVRAARVLYERMGGTAHDDVAVDVAWKIWAGFSDGRFRLEE